MTLYDQKKLNTVLIEKLDIKNVMSIPRITAITINAGIGRFKDEKNLIEKVTADITAIAGQKPVITKSKKSIAAFKLRENSPVGIKVTLRGKRMIDFLNKVINITLPRLRDFDGISRNNFDQQGNLSIGFREQTGFPEIKYENIDHTFGLQVNIRTTAGNKERAIALFEALGLPFKKEENNG